MKTNEENSMMNIFAGVPMVPQGPMMIPLAEIFSTQVQAPSGGLIRNTVRAWRQESDNRVLEAVNHNIKLKTDIMTGIATAQLSVMSQYEKMRVEIAEGMARVEGMNQDNRYKAARANIAENQNKMESFKVKQAVGHTPMEEFSALSPEMQEWLMAQARGTRKE